MRSSPAITPVSSESGPGLTVNSSAVTSLCLEDVSSSALDSCSEPLSIWSWRWSLPSQSWILGPLSSTFLILSFCFWYPRKLSDDSGLFHRQGDVISAAIFSPSFSPLF